MVNRKVSAALCVFGISFASVLAGAHDGKAKGKDKDRDDEKDDARIERGKKSRNPLCELCVLCGSLDDLQTPAAMYFFTAATVRSMSACVL